MTGLLANQGEAVGCYGDQVELSSEELLALDNEGRAVITQHHFRYVRGLNFQTFTSFRKAYHAVKASDMFFYSQWHRWTTEADSYQCLLSPS